MRVVCVQPRFPPLSFQEGFFAVPAASSVALGGVRHCSAEHLPNGEQSEGLLREEPINTVCVCVCVCKWCSLL